MSIGLQDAEHSASPSPRLWQRPRSAVSLVPPCCPPKGWRRFQEETRAQSFLSARTASGPLDERQCFIFHCDLAYHWEDQRQKLACFLQRFGLRLGILLGATLNSVDGHDRLVKATRALVDELFVHRSGGSCVRGAWNPIVTPYQRLQTLIASVVTVTQQLEKGEDDVVQPLMSTLRMVNSPLCPNWEHFLPHQEHQKHI
jgi:hypothetical protein